jgi:ParB/RepB/Spo0J family partition protein
VSTIAVQAQAAQRYVPLSSIVIEDGFNPRIAFPDDAEFKALVATIRDRGVLQPLRVRSVGDDYVLIAGERRYRAAVLASVMEVPVIVDISDADSVGAAGERLVDAVIENDIRVDLDPLSRALAYQRMKAEGLTIKGIAERLGKPGRAGQQRVREHLALLDLPEALHRLLASGAIPMSAVAPLLALHQAHAGLAELAVQRILEPENIEGLTEDEKPGWRELHDRPITVVSDHYSEFGGVLPVGVFGTFEHYPLSLFQLSDKTIKNLTALQKLTGEAVEDLQVIFNTKSIEQAAALQAVYADDYRGTPTLIAGQDVADELVATTIAATLKRRREDEKARRARAAEAESVKDPEDVDRDDTVRETPQQRAARAAAAEAKRVAESKRTSEELAAERAAAVAFNDRLGAAVYNGLSRVRVDGRVLRIVTAIPVATDLADLAMRGARYGMPGWVTETEGRGGKTKRIYLEKTPATAKAVEYLAGASTAGEIAGRTLALIVMASFADEAAVAQSSRSFCSVRASAMPWALDVDALLDEIVAENLRGELLTDKLAERAERRAEAQAAAQQAQELRAQLDAQLQRLTEVTAEELAALPALLGNVSGLTWLDRDDRTRAIREEVKRRNDAATVAALAAVLAKIGDALSLPDLTTKQLDEFEILATDSLTGDDLTAATAAIAADRQRRADANAQGDETEADQTS